MARKTEKVSLTDLKSKSGSRPSEAKTPTNTSPLIDRTVTFVDKKGRMWTAEMNLPENTSLETMRSIAQTNISMMSNRTINKTDLVVLIEPDELEDFNLKDVEQIVIFDRAKFGSMMGDGG